MRRANALSRALGFAYTVAKLFQTSRDLGNPRPDPWNILEDESPRTASGDKIEPKERETAALAAEAATRSVKCRRNAGVLAGRAAGPDFRVGRPAKQAQSGIEPGDAGEEVASQMPGKIVWPDSDDTALVDAPTLDAAARCKVAQPLRDEGVIVVVISAHESLETSRLAMPLGGDRIRISRGRAGQALALAGRRFASRAVDPSQARHGVTMRAEGERRVCGGGFFASSGAARTEIACGPLARKKWTGLGRIGYAGSVGTRWQKSSPWPARGGLPVAARENWLLA
jgi:hypothetical protein